MQMLWPRSLLYFPPLVTIPTGYRLRTYLSEDNNGYLSLMKESGFNEFNQDLLSDCIRHAIDGGFLVIEYSATGEIVATAAALHNPSPLHPYGGELSWVAVNLTHRGKGLGKAVCSAATTCFIKAGYKRIYLKTDDWRKPAIKTYLKLGYIPFLYVDNMLCRWKSVFKELNSTF